MSVDEILSAIDDLKIPTVEVTGGEPLAQKETADLIFQIAERGYKVLLETSGSEPISDLDPRCHIIMDLKCPDSGMESKNLLANLDHLKPSDEIKFVIASRKDFEWADYMIAHHRLSDKCSLSFSPAFGLLKPDLLASWILEGRWPKLRLNLQLHKFIWSPKAKGV